MVPRTIKVMFLGVCAAAVGLALTLALSGGDETRNLPVTTNVPKAPAVSIVYFYPNDQTPNQEYIDLVDTSVAEVQGWYRGVVDSTFAIDSVQVIQGKRNTAYYRDNTWTNILTELGYWCGTGVHLIFIHQEINSGWASGGACSGDKEGTAMLAETVMDIKLGRCDPADWRCGLGAIPHELGHAFFLSHSECISIMLCHWLYPNVGLTNGEITALQNHRYFGTAEPTPDTCTPKFNPHGKRVGRCK